MAQKAVEALKRALLSDGPTILKGTVFDHYGKDGKAVMGPRLQPNGAGPPGDVHNTGRALDICLYASAPPIFKVPSPERELGYGLVNIFIGLRSSMKWDTMIYDSKEWNNSDTFKPRQKTSYPTEMDRVKFEHLTHIHIDWASQNANDDSFFDELVGQLKDAGF